MLTFETKCYENDYEFILQGSRLARTIDNCGYAFERRQLVINNVKDRQKVGDLAEAAKARGLFDDYFFAEDYAEETLAHFHLSREDLGRGYYYSISELVGIHKCRTTYLLHFSSDAMIPRPSAVPWVVEAMERMVADPRLVCANPCWNFKYAEAKAESSSREGPWYLGQGFSDQCYLVPRALFDSDIYREAHPFSERYPSYGGELFEKRVDSYMRNHGLLRLTRADLSYRHRNFPKGGFKRRLELWRNSKA